jgi:hypothetical protein
VHRAVRRHHEVRLQRLGIRARELGDMGTADFLLAFQQYDDIARQSARYSKM